MIAKYEEQYYYYIKNKNNIITNFKEKTDENFIKEDNLFYKHIDPEDLSEIFDVKFIIKYDTGLENISPFWEVGGLKNNKFLIRYSNGCLPGWTIEENNICIKYIDSTKIEEMKEIKTYTKKDNILLNEPLVEEIIIKSENYISEFLLYDRKNL